jgi:hypothetical protein
MQFAEREENHGGDALFSCEWADSPSPVSSSPSLWTFFTDILVFLDTGIPKAVPRLLFSFFSITSSLSILLLGVGSSGGSSFPLFACTYTKRCFAKGSSFELAIMRKTYSSFSNDWSLRNTK